MISVFPRARGRHEHHDSFVCACEGWGGESNEINDTARTGGVYMSIFVLYVYCVSISISKSKCEEFLVGFQMCVAMFVTCV